MGMGGGVQGVLGFEWVAVSKGWVNGYGWWDVGGPGGGDVVRGDWVQG